MSTHRGWAWGLALCGLGLVVPVGCGPKEKPDTTPTRETAPPPDTRPSGPPKKLMPPDLRPQVEQVFTSGTGDLERCYNDYVVSTGDKKLKGTIIIAVTIGWRAAPSKIWFLRNDFKSHQKLTSCFLEKIQRWEFPTWGGVMDYSFRRLTLEEL